MMFTMNITFKPTEIRDYFHKIEIISDEETFSIPFYGKWLLFLYSVDSKILRIHSNKVEIQSIFTHFENRGRRIVQYIHF